MTTQHTSIPVSIEKGGPFAEAVRFELHDGINLLQGPNGAGKTWFMRVLEKFSATHELEVGDLTVNDELTGATAVAKCGTTEIRAKQGKTPVRVDGDALPPIQELPDQIKTLITGDNMKGELEVFMTRLNALLDFVGMRATKDMVEVLAGETVSGKLAAKEVLADRITDWVKDWRTQLMADRRKQRKNLEVLNRKLADCKGRITGLCDDDEVLEKQARAAIAEKTDLSGNSVQFERSSQEYYALKAKAESRAEEAARLKQLEEDLGSAPDETDTWEERRNKLRAEKESKRAELAAIERDCTTLENQLAAAQSAKREITEACMRIETDEIECDETIDALQKKNQEREEAKRRIREGVTLIPEEEVLKARAKMELDRAGKQLHDLTKSLSAALAEESDFYEQVEVTSNTIAEMDTELKDVYKRMADVVNNRLESDQGQKPIIWVEIDQTPRGRMIYHLMTRDNEGVERVFTGADYISEGMRVEACVRTMLMHLHGPRIVVMPGAVTISPRRRDLLGDLARKRRIKLVMEHPDEVGTDGQRIEMIYHPPLGA